MAQNSEQIEAKLCAYLEGELDEAGRAEIEKHLQQNPAHRRLLAEVGKTRDLLRALPREPAPPDICEAFQGQLERSVLLADLNTADTGTTLKINRWPQYFAVAAVVMLAAGLGLVVYFGLPSSTPRGTYATGGGSVATNGVRNEDGIMQGKPADAPATPTTGNSFATELAASTPVPGAMPRAMAPEARGKINAPDASIEAVQQQKTVETESMSLAQKPASAPAEAGATHDLKVLARQVQGAWEPAERERLFRKEAAGAADTADATQALASVSDRVMCYRITADQPAQAGEEVVRKLSEMAVAFVTYPQPDPAAVESKLGAVRGYGATPPLAKSDALAEMDTGAQPRGGATAGRQVRPDLGQIEKKQDVAEAKQEVAKGAPAAVPAQQESDAAAAAPAPAPPTVLADEASRTDRFAEAASRPQTLIVARNLTREQFDALGLSLNEERAGRQVTVHAGLPAFFRQRGLVASGDHAVINHGDSLRLVTRGGNGEENVTELQVNKDGAIAVPGVGDFTCAGLTVDQVRQRLRADFDTAAAGGEQVVSVSKVEANKDKAAQLRAASGPVVAMRSATDRVVQRSRVAGRDADVRLQGEAEPPPRPAPDVPAAGTRGGGFGGGAGQFRRRAEEPSAAGAAVATDAEQLEAAPQTQSQATHPATAPSAADERFDVVIVVESQPDAAQQPPAAANSPADAAAEPPAAEPPPQPTQEPQPTPQSTQEPQPPSDTPAPDNPPADAGEAPRH